MRIYRTTMQIVLLLALALVGSPQSASAAESVDVCIDPGHSLGEPGAINEAYNLEEVDINLEVSKRISQLLADAGVTYVFTWHNDPTLADSIGSGGNTSGDGLGGRERAKICNNANAKVVVSVHTNSIDSTTRDGVWMGYHGSESQQFAQDMLDLTWQNLFTDDDPWGLNNGSWRDGDTINYGTEVFANSLLIHTDVPAVLFEPLFMSDKGEAEVLQTTLFNSDGSLNTGCTNCRRGQIAQTLFAGIQAQLNTPAPPADGGNSCPPGKQKQGKC